MAKLFLTLSGEHENLPLAEAKAILETEGCRYKIIEKLNQLVRVTSDKKVAEILKRRAAFTRTCALELFNSEARIGEIVKALQSVSFHSFLKGNDSFAVRVKHVREYSRDIDGMALERKLGELILSKVEQARVNLKTPDKVFIGILTSDRFIFGLRLVEIEPKPFVERRPRKKPFFHPSAMQAKLARCMVNLARPKAGEIVLDPFCGTGSMLIEAGYIGCRVVGLDIQRRMAKGTKRNMAHFKVNAEGIIIADARNMPIAKVSCVVTDPPYGISSTTLKRTTGQLVEELLKSVHSLLEPQRRVCLAAPKTLKISRIAMGLGYKLSESYLVYVHRSLTREVVVFEKV